MTIEKHNGLAWYESEIEPPKEGPKIWFRPSDSAHFCRSEKGWLRYEPINLKFSIKVGETIAVNIPQC
jgi:hypothetical protein